jgi:protein SCO1
MIDKPPHQRPWRALRFRHVLGVLVAAVAVAASVLAVMSWAADGKSPAAPQTVAAGQRDNTAFRGAVIPAGKTAPDFTLRTEDGTHLRLSSERGRLVLITFLYTQCRDVCPLIAIGLDSIVRNLGKDARSVTILAISVDPKGDTPRAVRAYIRSHRLGREFHWLIGARTQLYPVWRAYNVGVSGENTDTVAHTAPVLLLDRRGRPRVYYQQPMSRRAIGHDLRVLLNAGQ